MAGFLARVGPRNRALTGELASGVFGAMRHADALERFIHESLALGAPIPRRSV
jgi:hypothetical protein